MGARDGMGSDRMLWVLSCLQYHAERLQSWGLEEMGEDRCGWTDPKFQSRVLTM